MLNNILELRGEPREEDRYKASWRAAIVSDGKIQFEGRTTDISPYGVAVLFPDNLQGGINVELHLLIPALNDGGVQKVVILHGRTCYSVHDAKFFRFRIGIDIDKFKEALDREYLLNILKSHHRPVAKSRYAP